MSPASAKIRVVVVDDSALMRKLLTSILSEDPDIEVVGSAPDPYVAREQIKTLNPDVVTLDVEMPHMNGIDFLRKIMELRPTPVVMISTLTQAGAETTLEALEIGAVDFVAKPADAGAIVTSAPNSFPRSRLRRARVCTVALPSSIGSRPGRRRTPPATRLSLSAPRPAASKH